MILGRSPFTRLVGTEAPVLRSPAATAFLYGVFLAPMTLPCTGPIVVSAFVIGERQRVGCPRRLVGVLRVLRPRLRLAARRPADARRPGPTPDHPLPRRPPPAHRGAVGGPARSGSPSTVTGPRCARRPSERASVSRRGCRRRGRCPSGRGSPRSGRPRCRPPARLGLGVLGVTRGGVSRWARPPQSTHVMIGSGSSITPHCARS